MTIAAVVTDVAAGVFADIPTAAVPFELRILPLGCLKLFYPFP